MIGVEILNCNKYIYGLNRGGTHRTPVGLMDQLGEDQQFR